MRKYGVSKMIRIMMATVPHVTSGLGLRKFQANGFLFDRVYHKLLSHYCKQYVSISIKSTMYDICESVLHQCNKVYMEIPLKYWVKNLTNLHTGRVLYIYKLQNLRCRLPVI